MGTYLEELVEGLADPRDPLEVVVVEPRVGEDGEQDLAGEARDGESRNFASSYRGRSK